MLSTTLKKGLDAYDIGPRLHALRMKKKMGLVELGRHTGLSPGLLSKLERGRLFPTLPTLLRIALVFSVGLEYFFAGARERPLVAISRRRDRVRLPDRPGRPDAIFRFESLDYPASERRFNSYYAEFFPALPEKLRRHDHPGVEFIYVLRGSLSVHIGDDEHMLEAGDAIYFDSSVSHGYRRRAGRTCTAIVTTSP
jgi:transcriptional regulator with XRE-family HTH domain